jgi:mannose-6-phosphate isomerase-like protein (cupin superfamily)
MLPSRFNPMERIKLLSIALLAVLTLGAREPLASRIAHTDPAKRQTVKAVHAGAGEIAYQSLLDAHSLDTNLYFVHRGVLQPKSSLGHHFHNNCEEMYVILDGEAEFTVNGRTSKLKAPAGAPCRLGHSHALYNSSDKPVNFLNINVSILKGENDAFNTDDPRVGMPLDPVPVFMAVSFDRALLRPVNAMAGGKGAVQYRRAIPPSVFSGPWAFTDHLLLPPGTAVGQQIHRGVAKVYYVMSGSGSIKVGPETAPIREGDAVPVQLNEVHSLENSGTEPLELLVVGVSRERNKEVQ